MSDDLHYGLTVTGSGPGVEPVTSDEVIDQLREDASLAQTAVINRLITAAREWAENHLRRALISTTYTMALDSFGPRIGDWPLSLVGGEIRLPRSPLASVDAIRYVDTEGSQQTLAASKYRVDTQSLVGRVTPVYGETWPSTYPVTNAVEIDFTAGYGASADDVPEGIRSAIILLVAHWYENRVPVVAGTIVSRVPMSVEFLLGPYRVRD